MSTARRDVVLQAVEGADRCARRHVLGEMRRRELGRVLEDAERERHDRFIGQPQHERPHLTEPRRVDADDHAVDR